MHDPASRRQLGAGLFSLALLLVAAAVDWWAFRRTDGTVVVSDFVHVVVDMAQPALLIAGAALRRPWSVDAALVSERASAVLDCTAEWVIALLMLLTAAGIFVAAVARSEVRPSHPTALILTGAVGVVLNVLDAAVLFAVKSKTAAAAARHAVADALASLLVVASGTLPLVGLAGGEPWLAIVFALVIGWGGRTILRDAVLMTRRL